MRPKPLMPSLIMEEPSERRKIESENDADSTLAGSSGSANSGDAAGGRLSEMHQ
jgi:hypothetical protein